MKNRFRPNYAVPPGATLAETIESMGMSQAELAQRMGRPIKTVNEIIQGKARITAATALELEKVLGVPASFWNNAEHNYREALARQELNRSLANHVAFLQRVPLREMVAWRWVRERDEPTTQLEEVLQFFGVASTSAWQNWTSALVKRLAVNFRKSEKFETNWAALAAWLRRGEIEAHKMRCPEFSEDGFRKSLLAIRSLTVEPPSVFQPRLIELCCQSGVAVTWVPPLPGTHVSGATRWLNACKALLQLSVRGKFNDLLWFTFFHEAGHLLLHGKKDVFIEDGNHDQKEKEADEFASDFLIPRTEYRRLTSQRITKDRVSRFAQELGIAPGIVVGRLQHEGVLPRSHFNDLKVRYQLVNEPPNV